MLFVIIFLLFSSLRNKLLLFVISIITFSVWGFLYNLDGIALILLTAEFTIVLLFLMTYIQLYSQFTFLVKKLNKNYYFSIIVLLLPLNLTPIITYINYYKSLFHVISSDFYIIYHILFDKLPLLVIAVTMIISLFSLFFILLYFNLKLVKNTHNSKITQIYFLRKQNLIKQTNFKSKIYTFQN